MYLTAQSSKFRHQPSNTPEEAFSSTSFLDELVLLCWTSLVDLLVDRPRVARWTEPNVSWPSSPGFFEYSLCSGSRRQVEAISEADALCLTARGGHCLGEPRVVGATDLEQVCARVLHEFYLGLLLRGIQLHRRCYQHGADACPGVHASLAARAVPHRAAWATTLTSCSCRMRRPSCSCRVPRHCGNLGHPQKYPPCPARRTSSG